MKIAFFGLPLAALLLRHDGHELTLVASPRRDAPGNRRARRLFGDRFLLLPRTDEALARRVRASGADLLVSWFWTKKLPATLLEACPRGAFGVHPSLLPRHRGPDPYFWAIDAGDAVTGVTAHRLAVEYDTGAILAQRSMVIPPQASAWKLAKALDRPSLSILREVASAFARGEPPVDREQDEALATAAPEPGDDDRALQLSWATARVLRRIRALSPAPGAELVLGDEVVTITEAEAATSFPAVLLPGEAVVDGEGHTVVRTGDGAIVLRRGERVEDDESVPIEAADFALLLGAESVIA